MNTSNEHAHQPAAAVNNNCYDDRKQSESVLPMTSTGKQGRFESVDLPATKLSSFNS